MGDLIQGPWPPKPPEPAEPKRPALPPAERPRWASERYYSPEERRAAILAAKPECADCGVMFHPRAYVPSDRVCLACRKKRALKPPQSGPPLATLFDVPEEKGDQPS